MRLKDVILEYNLMTVFSTEERVLFSVCVRA